MPKSAFESQPESRLSTLHAAIVAAFALAGAGLAALPAQAELGEQSLGGGVTTESTALFYAFPGTPKVNVSNHGNVLRFEGPTGYDHVGVGTLSEGYVLCYSGINAYDVGFTESGFGAATASCGGTTCTITRTTTDGRLRLKQVISKTAPERSLDIEMTLTKLGAGSVTGVILRRQVDLDVDTGGPAGSGDFTNWFGATERDSVFAWNATNSNPGEGHSVVLRHLRRSPTTVLYSPKVTSSILDTSCNPTNIAASGPVQGDYGVTVQYNVGTMGQGATFVGRVQYERN